MAIDNACCCWCCWCCDAKVDVATKLFTLHTYSIYCYIFDMTQALRADATNGAFIYWLHTDFHYLYTMRYEYAFKRTHKFTDLKSFAICLDTLIVYSAIVWFNLMIFDSFFLSSNEGKFCSFRMFLHHTNILTSDEKFN